MTATLQECFEQIKPDLTTLPTQVPQVPCVTSKRERLWQSLLDQPTWVRHEAMTTYDKLHHTNA